MTAPVTPTVAPPTVTKPTVVAGGSALALVALGVITSLLTHRSIDPAAITELITGGGLAAVTYLGHVFAGNAALRHDAGKVASELPKLQAALPLVETLGTDLKALAEQTVPGVAADAEARAAALEAKVDEALATLASHGVTTEAVRQAMVEIAAGTSVTKAVTAAAKVVDVAPPVVAPVPTVGTAGLTVPAPATV